MFLGSFQKYFCEDACVSLLQAVECVKHPVWYSVVCTSAITDNSQDSIRYDSDLIGHHFTCTSLRQSLEFGSTMYAAQCNKAQ